MRPTNDDLTDVIRVAASGGTDVTFRVDEAGDPFWFNYGPQEVHVEVRPGPSGCGVLGDSFEGKIVFDACPWPPISLGVFRSSVGIRLHEELITSITGGEEARVLERWLATFNHPAVYWMEHFCHGFNPGAKSPTGRIAEDERIFGCVQFGMGAYGLGSTVHYDGGVLSPSVWLDDELIEDEGVYECPALVRLCREIG